MDATEDCRVIAVGWDDYPLPPDTTTSLIDSLCEVTPRLEVTRPNLCTIPARGPSRYYGSEDGVCRRIRSAAHRILSRIDPDPRIGIGVADTRFAAELASGRNLVVPRGRTNEFLAELPVDALELLVSPTGTLGTTASTTTAPEVRLSTTTAVGQSGAEISHLCRLLQRLGLRTLGSFAALPADAVATRFGALGTLSHRIARGEQPTSLSFYQPQDPPAATIELDPPAERVDVALFAARSLIDDLMSALADRGLACSRLYIHAETEHAEHLSRHWRALTIFDTDMITERIRWQLTGWLDGRSGEARPTAGITLIRILANEVVHSSDLQLGLWGEMSHNDKRAARGLDRVRGLLGPGSVQTTMLVGGRGPKQRFALRQWGESRAPKSADSDPQNRPRDLPWPGHLPAPAPAIVHSIPISACCRGTDGRPVVVTARGALSAPLSQIQIEDQPWCNVIGWAGPWLSDEAWWNTSGHLRIARFQILLENQTAHLCVVDRGQWWVEASYD